LEPEYLVWGRLTTLAMLTSRQVRTLLGAFVAIVLFALAIRTSDIAGRIGRSEQVWFIYGCVVPVISFVHVLILERRSKSPRPRDG
jgi:lipopolysaccharide export LptBFGC system permease protein LptF